MISNLLHFLWDASWRASLIFVPLMLIYLTTRRHLPAAWRYGLWWLFLLRLVLPFHWVSPWSIYGFWERYPASMMADSSGASVPSPFSVTSVVKVGMDASTIPAWVSGQTLLLALWLAGVLGFGILGLWRANHFYQISKRASAAPLELREAWFETLSQMSIPSQPALGVSANVGVPTLFGVFRPKLLLPQSFVDGNTKSSRIFHAVFAHEAAHLKRKDLWLSAVESFILCLFWFHPLCWWVLHRMGREREKACDAIALNLLGSDQAKPLAHALLAFSTTNANLNRALLGGVFLSKGGKVLKDRLAHLTESPKPTGLGSSTFFAVMFLVIAALFYTLPKAVAQTPSNRTAPGGSASLVNLVLVPTQAAQTVVHQSQDGSRISGKGISKRLLTQLAFGLDAHQVIWTHNSQEHYEIDATAATPEHLKKALQDRLSEMGLQWQWQTQLETVYVLKSDSARRPKFSVKGGPPYISQKELKWQGMTTQDLANTLQGYYLHQNVIDATGFRHPFDVNLSFPTNNLQAITKGLEDYGFRLEVAERPVKKLVVRQSG